jgi:hypothetical protein
MACHKASQLPSMPISNVLEVYAVEGAVAELDAAVLVPSDGFNLMQGCAKTSMFWEKCAPCSSPAN